MSPVASIKGAFDADIPFDPAPHFSARGGKEITCVIIHHTAGGSMASSIAWAKDPRCESSWHFIIDRDGKISQQVALNMSAKHAGESQAMYKGKMTHYVNPFSIGIELANYGLLTTTDKGKTFTTDGKSAYKGAAPQYATLKRADGTAIVSGWWEPYPLTQIDALDKLLTKLRERGYAAACDNLMAHCEVCLPPGRKTDVGPLFPWNRFRPSPNIA